MKNGRVSLQLDRNGMVFNNQDNALSPMYSDEDSSVSPMGSPRSARYHVTRMNSPPGLYKSIWRYQCRYNCVVPCHSMVSIGRVTL